MTMFDDGDEVNVCENCGAVITLPIQRVRYCPSCARERLLRSLFDDDDEPDDDTPKLGVDAT